MAMELGSGETLELESHAAPGGPALVLVIDDDVVCELSPAEARSFASDLLKKATEAEAKAQTRARKEGKA